MFRRSAAVALAVAVLQISEAALRDTVQNATLGEVAGEGNVTSTVELQGASGARAAATAEGICPSREQGICLDRKQEALQRAGWTLEEADPAKCSDFAEEKIQPGQKLGDLYFEDDSTGTCWQVKENGASSITVGMCLPNGQGSKDHGIRTENWECLGRCGPGCSDATPTPSFFKRTSNWSKGCLLHDLCTYFTDSPQDPDGKLPGPLSSQTCKTAVTNAMASYTNPWYTYTGDSSYSEVCAR
jgi:hypothetical protein